MPHMRATQLRDSSMAPEGRGDSARKPTFMREPRPCASSCIASNSDTESSQTGLDQWDGGQAITHQAERCPAGTGRVPLGASAAESELGDTLTSSAPYHHFVFMSIITHFWNLGRSPVLFIYSILSRCLLDKTLLFQIIQRSPKEAEEWSPVTSLGFSTAG